MRWRNTALFLAVFTTCSCVWCIKSSYLIWQSPGAHQSRHGTAGTAVHRHPLIDSYQFNAQHLAARLNLACQHPRPKITHCSHTFDWLKRATYTPETHCINVHTSLRWYVIKRSNYYIYIFIVTIMFYQSILLMY